MTPDEWQELMEEPPGGPNHGRRKGVGDWLDLSPVEEETQRLGFDYIIYGPNHGVRSTYKDGCRCSSCRRAERDYRRRLRSASVRPQEPI